MTKKSFRLIAALLSSLALAISPLLSQPLTASAAGSGTLFGITSDGLVKIDPTSAAVTSFASLPPDPNTQGFDGVANDSAGHRIFIDRSVFTDQTVFPPLTADTIVTMDTTNGSGSVSAPLSQPLSGLVYDPSTSALIGLTQTHELVKVDVVSGAETNLAAVSGDFFSQMTVAPGKHELFIASSSSSSYPPPTTMLSVDTISGAVNTSPVLSAGAFSLAYDSTSGTLFGKTFCCPATLVSIDPGTGAEVVLGQDLGYGSNIVIDSSSHTVYVMEDSFGALGFTQNVATTDDRTGATAVAGPTNTQAYVGTLIFEGVAITPDSIEAYVKSALASGAISNSGVGAALLAELNAAADARARGNCSTAAKDYQAFIKMVSAQTGKAIAAATASELIGEARFLIANCP